MANQLIQNLQASDNPPEAAITVYLQGNTLNSINKFADIDQELFVQVDYPLNLPQIQIA